MVYSVLSILPFDAVQYEMLTASSEARKHIRSHVTYTEAK